jgi:hypothetical protein
MFNKYQHIVNRVIFSGITIMLCSFGFLAGNAAYANSNPVQGYNINKQTKQISPKQKKKKIRKNWETFFKGSTSMQKRVQLLQHGKKFKKALKSFSQSKMAKSASASVLGITLNGHGTATVKYTVKIDGAPVLKNKTGKAVHENGTWKVSDGAFCSLLELSGKTPKACKDISGNNSGS